MGKQYITNLKMTCELEFMNTSQINFVIRIFAYYRDQAGPAVLKWSFDSMAILNVIVSPNEIIKCVGAKWASKLFDQWLYFARSRSESLPLLVLTTGQ